jgi:hypothetical protein
MMTSSRAAPLPRRSRGRPPSNPIRDVVGLSAEEAAASGEGGGERGRRRSRLIADPRSEILISPRVLTRGPTIRWEAEHGDGGESASSGRDLRGVSTWRGGGGRDGVLGRGGRGSAGPESGPGWTGVLTSGEPMRAADGGVRRGPAMSSVSSKVTLKRTVLGPVEGVRGSRAPADPSRSPSPQPRNR